MPASFRISLCIQYSECSSRLRNSCCFYHGSSSKSWAVRWHILLAVFTACWYVSVQQLAVSSNMIYWFHRGMSSQGAHSCGLHYFLRGEHSTVSSEGLVVSVEWWSWVGTNCDQQRPRAIDSDKLAPILPSTTINNHLWPTSADPYVTSSWLNCDCYDHYNIRSAAYIEREEGD